MEEDKCNKVTVCWILVPCSSIIIALSVLVIIFSIKPPPHDLSKFSCPNDWIGYNKKCYYFSNTTDNKYFASEKCNDMNAELAHVKDVNELNFMLRYKGSDDYWVIIETNDKFVSDDTTGRKGSNNCVFLKDKTISSSLCNVAKKWICSFVLPIE
ncbi:C-type lectin-like protein [Magpiepox virus]|nr:C-type lectin-like protein [Magpiepox virus]